MKNKIKEFIHKLQMCHRCFGMGVIETGDSGDTITCPVCQGRGTL